MKNPTPVSSSSVIHILYAEDDIDDRFFFSEALNSIAMPVQLKMVENGEQLMAYLLKNIKNLPDVIFLDLNMPCKNGSECLEEIKKDIRLLHIPVIIYSTSVHDDIAEMLYKNGAHCYIRKTDITQLADILRDVLTLVMNKQFVRPERDRFVYTVKKVK